MNLENTQKIQANNENVEDNNAEVVDEQAQLVADIESDFKSNFINRKFEGIRMIPKVSDPLVRKDFQGRAHKFIEAVLHLADPRAPMSIINCSKAIECISCLDGDIKTEAINQAHKVYKYFKVALDKDPYDKFLQNFFVKIDDIDKILE